MIICKPAEAAALCVIHEPSYGRARHRLNKLIRWMQTGYRRKHGMISHQPIDGLAPCSLTLPALHTLVWPQLKRPRTSQETCSAHSTVFWRA